MTTDPPVAATRNGCSTSTLTAGGAPSALRKLECVEELMQRVRDTPQAVRSRMREEPVSAVRITLREYYAQKRRRYAIEQRGEGARLDVGGGSDGLLGEARYQRGQEREL